MRLRCLAAVVLIVTIGLTACALAIRCGVPDAESPPMARSMLGLASAQAALTLVAVLSLLTVFIAARLRQAATVLDNLTVNAVATARHHQPNGMTGRLGRSCDRLIDALHVAQRRQERELALALQRANQEALQAGQAKSQFLANISHELRTPLNGILGMTELALQADPAPRQRECLDAVRTSAAALLACIDDVLNFARIDAGGLILDAAEFDLRALIGETLRPLSERARAKALDLCCRLSPELPERVVGDPARLRQVLVHLVGNAIKFTEQGEVIVCGEVQKQRGDDTPFVVLDFAIHDTGIGIPAEKLGTIVEPFVQADGSKTRKYGGAGLGLTIASRLVAEMGGQLWAESEPGKGSTFHFTVRLGRREQRRAPSALEDRVDPVALRILLAEDNPVNQRVAVALLERLGHGVTVVDNGAAAARAVEGGEFDVVLMDVQMPEMDGLEATAAIRRRERATGRHLPIVAVTAATMPGDREECLRAGMDAYLSKPIQPTRLEQVLSEVVAQSNDKRDRVAASPTHFSQQDGACRIAALAGG